MIDVAAIEPVSSALPNAVTHSPTARALAVAASVRVYVVADDVFTVWVVGSAVLEDVVLGTAVPGTAVLGTAVVAVLVCGRELSTVKPVPPTAMTLPKAPSPPNPLPSTRLPPAPGPRVRPGSGVPAGRVGSPVAPEGRAPPRRSPPRVEQLPFTAGEISTEAATRVPAAALGAAVEAFPPVPEAGEALRAWTQTPTTTLDSFAATVLVKVVLAE